MLYEQERFYRHIVLPEIGEAGQKKLLNAKVLVVGAGGLGSPVLLYLAAAGVGTIGIIDNDVISLSNLQRQILYKTSEIGLPKVNVAKLRLLENNPNLLIETYQNFFTAKNALSIAIQYDLIVDCTDNFKSRYVIDKVSKELEIPMVYGSIAQYTGQVAVFNYQNSKSYADLFPEAPKVNARDESRLGVLGVLPGIIGSLQANEALKIILGFKDVLHNQLYSFDAKSLNSHIVEF